MRVHGIAGVLKPAKVRTTIPAEQNPLIPDLIGRSFTAGSRIEMVGDITCLRTDEGWLYLASVLDLCTRKLLGYAMAEHMRAELVVDAITMAITPQRPRRRRSSSTPIIPRSSLCRGSSGSPVLAGLPDGFLGLTTTGYRRL